MHGIDCFSWPRFNTLKNLIRKGCETSRFSISLIPNNNQLCPRRETYHNGGDRYDLSTVRRGYPRSPRNSVPNSHHPTPTAVIGILGALRVRSRVRRFHIHQYSKNWIYRSSLCHTQLHRWMRLYRVRCLRDCAGCCSQWHRKLLASRSLSKYRRMRTPFPPDWTAPNRDRIAP